MKILINKKNFKRVEAYSTFVKRMGSILYLLPCLQAIPTPPYSLNSTIVLPHFTFPLLSDTIIRKLLSTSSPTLLIYTFLFSGRNDNVFISLLIN